MDDWEALKKQVKEGNDIVDVVGTYVALRPAGPTFKGLCPFHDDHRPSFDVDPRRQRYRCWSCGKRGDVISFVQEHEHVDFREALELLARRAGISLEKLGGGPPDSGRARMLDLLAWAADQFHRCLLDAPEADAARRYLGERQISGETVRRFLLGYAPARGEWLVERAARAGLEVELLTRLGLIAARPERPGHYDRFRDRVMFPIRDAAGRVLGFGGRILPGSPSAERAPKYYNSPDSPLFTKSELLYGIDQARHAAAGAGYLAVVEGYTDVLMAHQLGVPQVVSTMGTALNARHVKHLRRFTRRVVLVFDADAGGDTGVDRALAIFVSQEVDLAVATLPVGMDPCDYLVREGATPFRQTLAGAVDALEFKLNHVLTAEDVAGVEGRRRAVDAVLGVIALAPELPGQAGALKRELVVNRVAHRLGVREETVWARLRELRAQRRPASPTPAEPAVRKARAPEREIQLMQVLLADPKLVPVAAAEVAPEEIEHPGIRFLLEGLFDLHAQGRAPDLDALRPRIANPDLYQHALRWQESGRQKPDQASWLEGLLAEFRHRRGLPRKQELQHRLQAARDHTEAVDLLRRLQQPASLRPGASPVQAPDPERGGF